MIENHPMDKPILNHSIYRNSEVNSDWVVFIHGAGGSSTIWYKQINSFRKHYHLLLIDLRGHGRTKVDEEINKRLDYTFDSIAQEIYDVLDVNSISKAHFVGVSLGTILIRQLVEIDQSRIISMVMSGAIVSLTNFSRILIIIGNSLKKSVPFLFLYTLFAFIILPKRSHKKSRSVFIHEAKKMKKTEFIRWFGLTRSLDKLLKVYQKSTHGLPILFISGKEDHLFIEDVKKMAQLEPKGKLEIVENCGHVVNIEKAEVFNEITLDYLHQQKVALTS
jgi:pimeloyl-ACP methyl ester carboxylesterase